MTSKIWENNEWRERDDGELRRPILVDAFTVAAGHVNFRERDGPILTPKNSMKGLLLVFKFFIQQGHKVFAFIPRSWIDPSCPFTYDGHVVADLVRMELVKVIRSPENVPYGMKSFQAAKNGSRKDTIELARVMGGVLVGYFQYREYITDSDHADKYKDIICNRFLVPTFIQNDVYFPLDGPAGRKGQIMSRILKCMPQDDDYALCSTPGCQLDRPHQKQLLKVLSDLIKTCKFNPDPPKNAFLHDLLLPHCERDGNSAVNSPSEDAVMIECEPSTSSGKSEVDMLLDLGGDEGASEGGGGTQGVTDAAGGSQSDAYPKWMNEFDPFAVGSDYGDKAKQIY